MKFEFRKPDSISREHYDGSVFNFQVDEDETYIANGVVVHNCILVPVLKTPSEMGLNVPKHVEDRAWAGQMAEVPNLRDRFFAMAPAEQAKVIGNQQLFKLWQEEKFPIDALIAKRGGMRGMMSYKDVVDRLPEIGSISYPKVELAGVKWLGDDVRMMTHMDPVDRSTPGVVAMDKTPARTAAKTAQGWNKWMTFPEMGKVSLEDLPAAIRRTLPQTSGTLDSLPWHRFNEVSRKLGLYARRMETGRVYYVVPKGVYTKIETRAVKIAGAPGVKVIPKVKGTPGVKELPTKNAVADSIGAVDKVQQALWSMEQELAEAKGILSGDERVAAQLQALERGYDNVMDALGLAANERTVQLGVMKGRPRVRVEYEVANYGAFYNRNIDEIVFNYQGSLRFGSPGQLVEMSLHEFIHAWGSLGNAHSIREGYTELMARVLATRNSVEFVPYAYHRYTEFAAGLSYVAANGNMAEAADIIKTLTVGSTKAGLREVNTVADYLWERGGFKEAFANNQQSFLSWFSGAEYRLTHFGKDLTNSAFNEIMEPINKWIVRSGGHLTDYEGGYLKFISRLANTK